jgi:hypothetical protein
MDPEEQDISEPGPTWSWDCDITGRKYTITFGAVEEIFEGEPSAAIWYSNPSAPEDHNEQPILVPMGMMVEAIAEVYEPEELREFFDDVTLRKAREQFEQLVDDEVNETEVEQTKAEEPVTDEASGWLEKLQKKKDLGIRPPLGGFLDDSTDE